MSLRDLFNEGLDLINQILDESIYHLFLTACLLVFAYYWSLICWHFLSITFPEDSTEENSYQLPIFKKFQIYIKEASENGSTFKAALLAFLSFIVWSLTGMLIAVIWMSPFFYFSFKVINGEITF